MIKAIIFDWSGVLSNDWEASFATENEVLETRGHRRLSKKEYKKLFELPWTNFYKKLGLKVDIEEEYALWDKICPKHSSKLKPVPRAKKTLQWLKKQKIKTIILSAHNKKLILQEIKQYGFQGLINEINASNNDKREKIQELIEKNEIEKESTIYVGDMRHDIETARLAGIKSVAVPSKYETRKSLEKENPDFIIKSVAELPKLIKRINSEK
jgi:phosphoglycolate phosphatase-like HAD superfamily hydrolase